LAHKLISPNPNKPAAVESPKTNKLMIQKKLAFGPVTKSPSTPSASAAKTALPKPVVRANGEWFIEDYLVDEQWKKWLADEFQKPYFKEINAVVREGYQKNIVRPPKELVFNALNSTRLDKIKVVIIGQDPYHDDGQVIMSLIISHKKIYLVVTVFFSKGTWFGFLCSQRNRTPTVASKHFHRA